MTSDSDGGAALPEGTGIGRVGLRVDDATALLPFYRNVIGCRVVEDGGTVRIAVSDDRPLLVLEERAGSPPRPRDAAGLFHVAIRVPDRAALAAALARIRASDATLTGASDHLVSEALYLRDPAGNGLEVYRDRPREAWTRSADGRVEMDTLPLDLEDLAAAGPATDRLPAGTDVGHVHLETTDLAAAVAFYVERIGFAISSGGYPDAEFLGAGGYHHHIGLNRWNRRTAPVGDHQGLRWFEIELPGTAARPAIVSRLEAAGVAVGEAGGVPAVTAPDGIGVRLPVRDQR